MCLKQIRNMRSNNGSKLRGKFWTNELNFKEFTISKKLCIIKKKIIMIVWLICRFGVTTVTICKRKEKKISLLLGL